MFAPWLFSVLSLWAASFSLALPHRPHDHDHSVNRALPGAWFQESDHPAHALFRRQESPTDGVTYPAVGSASWTAAYPSGIPNTSALPQEWVNALNDAVAAGKIPNLPASTVVNSNPVYPSGTNANGPAVCSSYVQCRMPDDIWYAPAGALGIGFDDGPSLGSAMLYNFLSQNNQRATHFMIGINILNNPSLFLRAYNDLQGDIAVHTWTHRYMTSLSNLDLVAEFGWSMQIIHDSTGGRLPRYWRPPYGDMDNRVRAITKEIFGLEPILWNQDTEDWSLTSGGTTLQQINTSMTKWLTGPKSPGLIILEHELSNQAAQAFENAYPLMISQGWNLQSAATLNGTSVYLNSEDGTSSVDKVDGVLYSDVQVASSEMATSSAAPSGSSSLSPSGTGLPSSQLSGANRSLSISIAMCFIGTLVFTLFS